MRTTRILAALAAVAASAVAALPAAAAPGDVRVVASHLNNPRGIDIAKDGSIYIAEAGAAGPSCQSGGPDGEICFGYTGSITKLRHGHQSRIEFGLASVGGRDGTFTTGVDDVAVGADGSLYAIMTSAGQDDAWLPNGARHQLGNLLRFRFGHGFSVAGDVDAFEWASNPDGAQLDSDPYSVIALPGREIVADAAGNDVVEVKNGKVSLVAVLPKNAVGAESVPTSLAVGKDGSIYVGELGGEGPVPTPNGGSRIWRIAPGQAPVLWATGLTEITGLATGWDGSVYATELQTNRTDPNSVAGDVVKISPDASTMTHLGTGKLFGPGGIAVAKNGDIFVSNFSVLPATTDPAGPFGGAGGQVVELFQ